MPNTWLPKQSRLWFSNRSKTGEDKLSSKLNNNLTYDAHVADVRPLVHLGTNLVNRKVHLGKKKSPGTRKPRQSKNCLSMRAANHHGPGLSCLAADKRTGRSHGRAHQASQDSRPMNEHANVAPAGGLLPMKNWRGWQSVPAAAPVLHVSPSSPETPAANNHVPWPLSTPCLSQFSKSGQRVVSPIDYVLHTMAA